MEANRSPSPQQPGNAAQWRGGITFNVGQKELRFA